MTLVDKNDCVLGQATREECHQLPGRLHRAILITVQDENGRILLAKRGKGKLWQGVWDGTVATHVYPQEELQEAAKRALVKELGLKETFLRKHGFFVYQAQWGEKGVEYEICHLFDTKIEGLIKANKKEIAALRWIEKEVLQKEIQKTPSSFTPWFLKGFKRV